MSKHIRTGSVKEVCATFEKEEVQYMQRSSSTQHIPDTTKDQSSMTLCSVHTDMPLPVHKAIPEIHEICSASPGPKMKALGSFKGGTSTVVSQTYPTGQSTPSSIAPINSMSGQALCPLPIGPKPRPEKVISKPNAMSPPPVGPKPIGKLRTVRNKDTQPDYLLPPRNDPRQGCNEQHLGLQRTLSDSAVDRRKPPVSPKPQVHSKWQRALPGNLSKRWSHQPSSNAHGFTTSTAVPRPSQVKFKDITRHLDTLFEEIRPTALRAKWLKGKVSVDSPELLEDENRLEILHEDRCHDFESTAKALGHRLLEIRKCISKAEGINLMALRDILSQLERKRILICVFGQHNSGKSTFLNALLSNELLPMRGVNETSVKVCIKHISQVHCGPCLSQSTEQGDNICEGCPFLQVLGADKECRVICARGAEDVQTFLKKINADVREHNKKVTCEYEVNTYVHCLSDASAPPSWTLLLADNPGLGEVSEHSRIMEQAELGLAVGSAFVFIVSYNRLDEANDVAALKKIYEKDSRVFEENRLIVAVTRFDQYYDKRRDCSDSDEDDDAPLSPDEVKDKIANHVLKATDGAKSIPRENVILICGQWALYSRLLAHRPLDTKLQRCGKKFFNTLGQDPPHDPVEMAHRLEELSGIQEIEMRVTLMAHSCFETWVSSTQGKFRGLLRQAHDKLVEMAQSLEEYASGFEKDCSEHKDQQDALDEQIQELEGLADPDSTVEKELTKAYREDTEMPLKKAKEAVQKATEEFTKTCMEKCGRIYGPDEFQEDTKTLLEEVSEGVRHTILTTYKFNTINKVLEKNKESLGTIQSDLVKLASELLHDKATSDFETGLKQPGSVAIEDIMKGIPTGLTDLEIPVPELTHKILKKIWNAVRKLTFSAGYGPSDLEKPIEDLKKDMERQCSMYFEAPETMQKIIKFYFEKYRTGVNGLLEVFRRKYKSRIEERRVEIFQEDSAIKTVKAEAAILRDWAVHVSPSNMGSYLDRKAAEHLRQLHDSIALKQQASNVFPPASGSSSDEEPDFTEGLVVINEDGNVGFHKPTATTPLITVHMLGKQHTVQAEKGLSVQQVLEMEGSLHSVNLSDYIAHDDNGPIDCQKDSTLFAGEELYLQSRDSMAELETADTAVCGRKRSDALILDDKLPDSASDASTVGQQLPWQQQLEPMPGRSDSVEPSTPPPKLKHLDRDDSAPRKPVQFVGSQISVKLHVQKSAETPEIEPSDLPEIPASFEEDFREDLIATCAVVKVRLEQLQKQYPFLNLVSAELIHAWKLSEKQSICIATVGHYNSGKSSLLNALTGHSELIRECGTRVVEECRGVHEISDVLRLLNRRVRQNASVDLPKYVIHTNIPMFAFVPQAWQIYLEDNPGFQMVTQEEQRSQFMEEVMGLSAYVYTVPYDRAQDAIVTGPFKMISDQDQAKAAFLQDRLIVVVTCFDQFYKAVNKEEMLTVEQVQATVCSSIKEVTGRTFPKESVVPVCTHWALIARQLIQRPDDSKLKHRALQCLKHCFESEVGNENPLSIAKLLEKASGIITLEERFAEVSQQACNDSNTDVTDGCLTYIGVALKMLTDHIHGTQETIQVHESSQRRLQSIMKFKGFLATEPSSEMQSAYIKEIMVLSNDLQTKYREDLERLQEQCLVKVAAGQPLQKAEMEKEMGQVLTTFSEEVTRALTNGAFSQSQFNDLTKEVEEEYQKMRECAFTLCTSVQKTDEFLTPKDPHPLRKVHLAVLEDMPLHLTLKDVKGTMKGVSFRHRSAHSDVKKVLHNLEKATADILMKYLNEFGRKLLKLYETLYCDIARTRLSDFEEEFSSRLKKREEELEMMQEVKRSSEAYATDLRKWYDHLEKLKQHLEKKSKQAVAKAKH